MLSSTSCMTKSSQTRAVVFWTKFVDENISERNAGENDESDLAMRLVQLRLDVRNPFLKLGYHVKENFTTGLFSHNNNNNNNNNNNILTPVEPFGHAVLL